MATDREPEVPRTLAAWHQFREECWRRQRPDWIPEDLGIGWPEDVEDGPGWIPIAEDHPFEGKTFCWRCIAEAQGYPSSSVPHIRPQTGVVCWRQSSAADGVEQVQAAEDQPTEDREQDGGQAGPEQPPCFWPAPHWSSIYLPPPGTPVTIRQDGQPAIEGRLVGLTRLDAEGCPLSPPEPWSGFPSWTDDAEAEPVDEDIPQWPPQPVEIPLPADQFLATHGQPEEVDEP